MLATLLTLGALQPTRNVVPNYAQFGGFTIGITILSRADAHLGKGRVPPNGDPATARVWNLRGTDLILRLDSYGNTGIGRNGLRAEILSLRRERAHPRGMPTTVLTWMGDRRLISDLFQSSPRAAVARLERFGIQLSGMNPRRPEPKSVLLSTVTSGTIAGTKRNFMLSLNFAGGQLTAINVQRL